MRWSIGLLCWLLAWAGVASAQLIPPPPRVAQDGVALPPRPILNMEGAGVTCTPGATAINCAVPGAVTDLTWTVSATPQLVICGDSGDANPGTVTILPGAANVHLQTADPDGCTVTMDETGIASGRTTTIRNVGGNTATFSTSAGVLALQSTPFVMPAGGTLMLTYDGSQWNERGRTPVGTTANTPNTVLQRDANGAIAPKLTRYTTAALPDCGALGDDVAFVVEETTNCQDLAAGAPPLACVCRAGEAVPLHNPTVPTPGLTAVTNVDRTVENANEANPLVLKDGMMQVRWYLDSTTGFVVECLNGVTPCDQTWKLGAGRVLRVKNAGGDDLFTVDNDTGRTAVARGMLDLPEYTLATQPACGASTKGRYRVTNSTDCVNESPGQATDCYCDGTTVIPIGGGGSTTPTWGQTVQQGRAVEDAVNEAAALRMGSPTHYKKVWGDATGVQEKYVCDGQPCNRVFPLSAGTKWEWAQPDGTPIGTINADGTMTGFLKTRKNSSGSVFSRGRLNLVEGSNVTLTVADDAANDEIDVTVAATVPTTTKTAFWSQVTGSNVCEANPGTHYFFGNVTGSSSGNVVYRTPVGGTLKRLYVKTSVNVPTGQTVTVRLRVNQADTSIACNVAGGTSECSDLTNTASIAAGDVIQFSESCSGGTSMVANLFASAVIE